MIQEMKGTTALLPTSYFPSLLYLKVINTFETSIEIYETYQKRTIRNRTVILTANGPFRLSIPLQKGKTKSKITDTKISFEESWQIQHLKHLKSAYGSSPYYEHYIDDIAQILEESPQQLLDLNFKILDYFHDLGYCCSWKLTQSYNYDVGKEIKDYRGNDLLEWESQLPYHQVFQHKFGFVDGLSCLDLLFNMGPEGSAYL